MHLRPHIRLLIGSIVLCGCAITRTPASTTGIRSRTVLAAAAMSQPKVHGVHRLTPKAVAIISQGDITSWKGDAIVNAANQPMLGGGGVDGAIHRKAGPELYQACLKVKPDEQGRRCRTGEARITGGFRLPAKHVIHTVGPVYDDYMDSEAEDLLTSAVRSSLHLASESGLTSIAFPAISCGVYGYPKPEAAVVHLHTAKQALEDSTSSIKEVHFVLFEDDALEAWLEAAEQLGLPAAEPEEPQAGAAEQPQEEPAAQETDENMQELACTSDAATEQCSAEERKGSQT